MSSLTDKINYQFTIVSITVVSYKYTPIKFKDEWNIEITFVRGESHFWIGLDCENLCPQKETHIVWK